MEVRKIGELIPANELLLNETEEIRIAAASDNRYLIYLPYSTKVAIRKEWPDCQVQAIDLETKRCAWVDCRAEEGRTVIEMHPFGSDALLIVEFPA